MAEEPQLSENEKLAKSIVSDALALRAERRATLDAKRADLNLTLNLTAREQRALVRMLEELNIGSPTEFVRDAIAEFGTKRKQAKLEAIGRDAWPNGEPEPGSF